MGISYAKWDGDIWVQVEDGVVRRNLPRRTGTARSWHENGELEEEYELVDGVVVGERRQWHDNGVLAKTEPHVSGRVHGTVRQWNREGNMLGEYTMTDGRGVQREWNEDGTISMEHEHFSEGTARVKVFDDLGKAHESFMWNGKRVSKKKFLERLGLPQEGQMPSGGQDSPSCSRPSRSGEGGVTIMNEPEEEAIKEETKEIDPNHIQMLYWLEKIKGPRLEAEPGAMAELLRATRILLRADPRLSAKVIQAYRTAGFSEELIARHFGGDSHDRKGKKRKRP